MSAAGERKFAVLLLAHGTPEKIEEIPEYLKNVVSGRPMPQHVVEEIQHRYAQIGKSPLTEWTLRQAELLQSKLRLPVYVGMRNWKPYIAETVRTMRSEGITDAVAICLAPQNSRTSVGLYRRAAYAEAESALRFHFIDGWAEHPLLADAFAERLGVTWRKACESVGEKLPVVFTAHSVPCRTVQAQPASAPQASDAEAVAGTSSPRSYARPTAPERSYALGAGSAAGPDPYAIQAKQTAALVAARLATAGLTQRDWYFAFQSQGMSGGPWIGPTVEDTLRSLRQEGHRGVVLQPIGFLCDHVEILYDIDIAFQQNARTLGLQLFRPESLNGSLLLIEALCDLALCGLAELQASALIPASTPA
ncbi:MAG TPA: ferrochelatase [Acidobacteriaceae bacterium]|nr:ferrochelatase [Acidobacteriaceae bacterium]